LAVNLEYALHIPAEIEQQIRQLRASVKKAIRSRLQAIATGAAASATGAQFQPLGPPFRFYAERYRIFYRVEPETRRVVVLEIRTAFA
jgi:mRNA-degrading endonuclease RelE of RelBE toxin-antitoxin system